MTPKQAINFFHGASRLARALGVSPQSVSDWDDAGVMPEGRQYQCELATGGRLKADLPALRMSSEEVHRLGLHVFPLPVPTLPREQAQDQVETHQAQAAA